MGQSHPTAWRVAMRLALPTLLALPTTGCVDVVRAAAMPCVVLGVGAPADQAVLVGQVRAPRHTLTGAAPDDAPLDEAPVPGARVYLADGLGTPLPGLPTATTDDAGRYRLDGVPNGHTYVVVADFVVGGEGTRKGSGPSGPLRGPLGDRTATLEALAQATAGTVTTDLTLATSLVTVDLSEVLNGFSANLRPERYEAAVARAHRLLTNDRVPDLTDKPDVMALSATLLNVSPDLRSALSELKQDLATSAAPPLVE
jgi:hypothetical protein